MINNELVVDYSNVVLSVDNKNVETGSKLPYKKLCMCVCWSGLSSILAAPCSITMPSPDNSQHYTTKTPQYVAFKLMIPTIASCLSRFLYTAVICFEICFWPELENNKRTPNIDHLCANPKLSSQLSFYRKQKTTLLNIYFIVFCSYTKSV